MPREYNLRPTPGDKPEPVQKKIDDDDICSIGKRNGKRMGDVEVWFWVFVWNKFLHKTPNKPEAQYIIQHIDQLDKETDEMFVPDPRTFRK